MRVEVVIPRDYVEKHVNPKLMMECLHWSAFDKMMDGSWHTTDMVFRGLVLTGRPGMFEQLYILEADLHEGLPEHNYDGTTFRSDWVPETIRLMKNVEAKVLQEV